MKNLLFLLLCTSIASATFGQTTHDLFAFDNYFMPETLYIEPGDTVSFTTLGYHSATEVDSIDWVNNELIPNQGFDVGFGSGSSSTKFTIDSEGIHYNMCRPHASMGMKSIIIVGSGNLNLEDVQKRELVRIFPNPSSQMITIQNSSSVQIISTEGKKMFVQKNLSQVEQINVSSLPKGLYFVVLDDGVQKLVVE